MSYQLRAEIDYRFSSEKIFQGDFATFNFFLSTSTAQLPSVNCAFHSLS